MKAKTDEQLLDEYIEKYVVGGEREKSRFIYRHRKMFSINDTQQLNAAWNQHYQVLRPLYKHSVGFAGYRLRVRMLELSEAICEAGSDKFKQVLRKIADGRSPRT